MCPRICIPRNETLPTGYMLTPAARERNKPALLLLVSGAADIEMLQSIIALTGPIDALAGIDVADQRRLDTPGLDVDPSRIVRIEARELADLSTSDLKRILLPAIDRLVSGAAEIFPSAGGAVGGVAEGIQFLNREQDVAMVLDALRSGRNVLLRAPRRSGKTSLLRAIEHVPDSGLVTHFLDVERDRTLEGTAARFLASVSDRPLRQAIGRVEEIGWQGTLREAIEQSSDPAKRTVLLLDELVLMFDVFSSDRESTSDLADIRALLTADDFIWMIETFPLLQSKTHVRFASRLWRRWWRAQAGLES